MKNITIDLGNFNTKYLGETRGMFSSKFSTAFNPNKDAFERIDINGATTYISTGELDREYNKVDKNYMPILMYAISKATNDNNINLCLLLPVNQLPNKAKMINDLQGKSFEFSINGVNRKVFIHKVAILPEGYVSYYSLNQDKVKTKDILIIDIGSRTINIASFIEGTIEKNFTHKLGTYDLYRTIKEIENAKGEDYVEEDIERLIKRNRITVDDEIYIEFLRQILNAAKGNINIRNYEVIFTGGGSLLLESYIRCCTPAALHPEGIYSNVIGASNICSNAWR